MARLSKGEPLRPILGAKGMPSNGSWFNWIDQQCGVPLAEGGAGTLMERYSRARAIGAHHNADRAVQEALDATDAATGRLRMDALKWHAGRMLPSVYGDGVLMKMANHKGDGPVEIETNVPLVSALMGYLRGGALPAASAEPIDVTPRARVAPIEESESRLAKAMGAPLIDSQGDGPAGASPGQGGTLVGKRKAAMRSERIAVLAAHDAVRAKAASVADSDTADGAAWDLV